MISWDDAVLIIIAIHFNNRIKYVWLELSHYTIPYTLHLTPYTLHLIAMFTSFPPITKALLILSLIWALLIMFMPGFSAYWAHNLFVVAGFWWQVAVQMWAYSFLHWGVLHFFSNALFLVLFWWPLEKHLWQKTYLIFFLFSTLFTWSLLLYFSNVPTIGISGFCMGILTYTLLLMKSQNNPQYQSALLLLVINIWIGFQGNISFWWHALWAVSGALFYIFVRNFWLFSIANNRYDSF